eukprot:6813630-Alexandrium_andersonii.AAC.1
MCIRDSPWSARGPWRTPESRAEPRRATATSGDSRRMPKGHGELWKAMWSLGEPSAPLRAPSPEGEHVNPCDPGGR